MSCSGGWESVDLDFCTSDDGTKRKLEVGRKSCFGARGGVDCEMWGILSQWDTVIEESRAGKGEAGCLLRFWWSGKAFWKLWYNRTSKRGWDMARC